MIGPDLQADTRGSEASAVNEVDRPQLVWSGLRLPLCHSDLSAALVIGRSDHVGKKRLKICLANNYNFVMIRVL